MQGDPIWQWATEKLTAQDLYNKLLLTKDCLQHTDWYVAAVQGDPDLLKKVKECSKDELTTEEVKKFLLATNRREQTVWHFASMGDNLNLSHKQWEWTKEKLTGQEINNKLLLAADRTELFVLDFTSFLAT